MAHSTAKQIFVNLPVKDLKRSMEFFEELGFAFNPQFTDDNAACLVIGENIFAMLLVENFFKTFTIKEISDTTRSTEVINAISVNSRADVDEMVQKAVEAGGREPRDKEDHGWMYGRSFQDIDGHLWEVVHVSEIPGQSEAFN